MLGEVNFGVGNADRMRAILTELREHWGAERKYEGLSLFDTLAHIVLSHQSESGRTRSTFCALKSRWPNWADIEDAPEGEIEAIIVAGGFASRRTASLKAMVRRCRTSYGSVAQFEREVSSLSTEDAIAEMCALPGVGPKTARCAALYALGRDVQPMDAHILRVLRRMGFLQIGDLGDEEDHRRIERLMVGCDMMSAHFNLIQHGRSVCTPKSPDCTACPVANMCQFGAKALEMDHGAMEVELEPHA